MNEVQFPEVFTVEEISRAVDVPPADVAALIASGHLRPVTGSRFVAADEAVRVGRELRRKARRIPTQVPNIFSAAVGDRRKPVGPAFASSLLHGVLLALAFLVSAMNAGTAATEEETHEPTRMVFVVSPGPGGGGGGGGLRNPLPAPKVERKAPALRRVLTVPEVTPRPVVTTPKRDVNPPKATLAAAPIIQPKPPQREPDPLPSHILVAPVVANAADKRDKEGVIEHPKGNADSQGSGSGGGAGTGQGTGNGEGLGSGIGDGSGGGTGGGPYRPGSGIEPPQLVREVKADYTDEARRRNINGEVLLEIVVRSDGSVGDVRVTRGLGGGLNEQAVQAVRQWKFRPARRKGVPVDVIVEVAVDFVLR